VPAGCHVLWRKAPHKTLAALVHDSLAHIPAGTGVRVFFRADDIGVPSRSFSRLLAIFSRQQAPLALAVVPAWLTQPRWRFLLRASTGNRRRWCWHQHGWRHVNHEKRGKKQEFGPARTPAMLEADLLRGRKRLQALMGDRFTPIFTPPWNRCSREALALLKAHGYLAVSRDAGARATGPLGPPDIAVNVDLHTRCESDAQDAARGLAAELRYAFARGTCGIMIHHRRMNAAALEFLALLVGTLAAHPRVHLVDMRDLADRSRSP